MVQAFAALFNRLSNRTVGTRGRQQLHVAFGDFQQRFFDAIAFNDFAMIYFGTKGPLVIINGGFEVFDSNSDVVDFGENHVNRMPRKIRRAGIG